MKTYISVRTGLILTLFMTNFLFGCSDSGEVSVMESKPSANARPTNAGEGKVLRVEGKKAPLVIAEGDNREAFLQQPMPEVWLLDNSTGERVDLSPESNRVLKGYWVGKLANVFCTEIEPVNGSQRIECDKKLTRLANQVDRELQKQTINVSEIRRTIYDEEAGSLIRFMGLAAGELVKELKQQEH